MHLFNCQPNITCWLTFFFSPYRHPSNPGTRSHHHSPQTQLADVHLFHHRRVLLAMQFFACNNFFNRIFPVDISRLFPLFAIRSF
mgnify:CR=1 FL=1